MKNNNKIYVISNMFPSKEHVRYGVFVRNLSSILSESEFDVKNITLTKKTSIINKIIGYFLIYFKSFLLLFTAKKKDIIYIHYPLYFSPIISLYTLFNKKVVLNFHGSDAYFNTSFRKALGFILSTMISKTQLIVVPSESFKNKILNQFNIKSESVFVYPSGGVDETVFYPIKIENKALVLGFISNLILSKGWIQFIEALDQLKQKNISFEAIVVGEGPDKSKLMKLINNLSLNNYITLLPNTKQSELKNIYSKLDLFIFPTYRESLGLVAVESLMCGTPVVASDIDGPNEYIEDGYNGYLFELRNTQALVNKIINFNQLSNNEKEKMSSNAKKSAKKYAKSIVTNAIINRLNNVKK